MPSVFFVGPLPPPVHGFSVINGQMLDAMRARGAAVQVFDMAPRSKLAPLWQWLAFMGALLRAGRSGRGGAALYLPISGGVRQLIDLAFALPAKLLGLRIFVHHHSFAYLNQSPWHARWAFAVLRNATHIVLCGSMGHKLAARYGIAAHNTRVLSNAAFMALAAEPGPALQADNAQTTLGFLSNITAEKGIFKFFDALDALAAAGVDCRAVIAGPVDPSIQSAFAARLGATAHVRHIGPVYGEAKGQFFSSIDVLLFPTQYANEAEPVTLWEAMAQGVPVVALQRGCIQGMVPLDAGRVVDQPDDFAAAVVQEVSALRATPALLQARRVAAKNAFATARAAYVQALDALLDAITLDSITQPGFPMDKNKP
jgi:glycosyltransferase involved in cell wall biosynthesis